MVDGDHVYDDHDEGHVNDVDNHHGHDNNIALIIIMMMIKRFIVNSCHL